MRVRQPPVCSGSHLPTRKGEESRSRIRSRTYEVAQASRPLWRGQPARAFWSCDPNFASFPSKGVESLCRSGTLPSTAGGTPALSQALNLPHLARIVSHFEREIESFLRLMSLIDPAAYKCGNCVWQSFPNVKELTVRPARLGMSSTVWLPKEGFCTR